MPAPHLTDRDATFMVLYPEIFGPGPWHTEPSPICWGLAIGDGWMPLLHRLCEDLAQIVREDRLMRFRAIQVKEKSASCVSTPAAATTASWVMMATT